MTKILRAKILGSKKIERMPGDRQIDNILARSKVALDKSGIYVLKSDERRLIS